MFRQIDRFENNTKQCQTNTATGACSQGTGGGMQSTALLAGCAEFF